MNQDRNMRSRARKDYGAATGGSHGGHPLMLEVNTRCWLRELSEAAGRSMDLSNLPDAVFDAWAELGVTHLWLMGVWTTGPLSRRRALSHPALRREFDRALPGWQAADVAGSPYAIERYEVSESLGGEGGLREFRHRLSTRGMKLVLDFVPNHTGLDHSWIQEHPEYFVRGPAGHPNTFASEVARVESLWIAHGRDPHFAPWDDTAQLDYRRREVHRAMQRELVRIAQRCDGVRCDMAMLLLHDVFESTWKEFPVGDPKGGRAAEEFWESAIREVKAARPDFLFLAEVYWDKEARLQALGFDFTYDKQLTDALLRGEGRVATRHVGAASPEFLRRSAHFLENHDEPRVAGVLSLEQHRAAALAVLGLPGMRFLQEGQITGAIIRTPVQLQRRQHEPVNQPIRELYCRLLGALREAGVGRAGGEVLRAGPAWPGNPTFGNLLVVRWGAGEPRFALVIVNVSGQQSQCHVPLRIDGSEACGWRLTDLLGEERWERSSSELRDPGLFLDVAAHACQVFLLQPQAGSSGTGACHS